MCQVHGVVSSRKPWGLPVQILSANHINHIRPRRFYATLVSYIYIPLLAHSLYHKQPRLLASVSRLALESMSTSLGHEGVPPASTKGSTYVNVALAGAGTTESPCPATSGRSYRGTPVDTTPDVSFWSTDGRYEEGVSPTIPGVKPERPSFECSLCSERKLFTQRQVLLRHHREKHQPGFKCSRPNCDHVWTQSRRSEHRKHLRKKHGLEDDEINEILTQPPIPRVIESDLPPHFSPPPIDVHHASPSLIPLIPSVAHSRRLGDGKPKVTTTEHENGGLEHLGATHAPSRLSEEESTLVRRHYETFGRFLSVHAFSCVIYMIDCSQISVGPPRYCRHPTQPRDAAYPHTPRAAATPAETVVLLCHLFFPGTVPSNSANASGSIKEVG